MSESLRENFEVETGERDDSSHSKLCHRNGKIIQFIESHSPENKPKVWFWINLGCISLGCIMLATLHYSSNKSYDFPTYPFILYDFLISFIWTFEALGTLLYGRFQGMHRYISICEIIVAIFFTMEALDQGIEGEVPEVEQKRALGTVFFDVLVYMGMCVYNLSCMKIDVFY